MADNHDNGAFDIAIVSRHRKKIERGTLTLTPSSTVRHLEDEVRRKLQTPKTINGRMSFIGNHPPEKIRLEGKAMIGDLGLQPGMKYDVDVVPETRDKSTRQAAIAAHGKTRQATIAFEADEKKKKQDERRKKKKKKVSGEGTKITPMGTGQHLSDRKKMSGKSHQDPLVSSKETKSPRMEHMGMGHTLMGANTNDDSMKAKGMNVKVASAAVGGAGRKAKHLRAVIKKELESRWSDRSAQKRLESVNSNGFQLSETQGGCTDRGSSTIRTIMYGIKLEEKDKIFLLTPIMLQYQLPALHLEKKLVPMNHAKILSLFWSLVHSFPSRILIGDVEDGIVEEMLRRTFQDLDWSHLGRGGRERKMSTLAKVAKDNLAQQKPAKPAAQEGEDIGQGWMLNTHEHLALGEVKACIMRNEFSPSYGEVSSWGDIETSDDALATIVSFQC